MYLECMTCLLQDEVNFRIVFQLCPHLLYTTAPGLDKLHIFKNRSKDTVADFASAGSQFLERKKVWKGAGAGDLQHIIIYGHFYIAPQDGVIPMNDRINQRLANCLHGIFPAVFAVYLSDGGTKRNIFLDECHAWFDGCEDRLIDGRLIQKNSSFGTLEPGAFYFCIWMILFSGLRIRQKERSIFRIIPLPLCMEQAKVFNKVAF